MSGAPTPNADGRYPLEALRGQEVDASVLADPITGLPSPLSMTGRVQTECLTSTGVPSGTVIVPPASLAGVKRWLTNGTQVEFLIDSFSLMLSGAAIDLDGFGCEAAALTTGVTVGVYTGASTLLSAPFTAAAIKSNLQAMTLADAVLTSTGGTDVLRLTWRLPRAQFVQPGDRVEVTVGDSLAATALAASVSGWWVLPPY